MACNNPNCDHCHSNRPLSEDERRAAWQANYVREHGVDAWMRAEREQARAMKRAKDQPEYTGYENDNF